jgi:sialate O-acetylesterase
MKTLVIFTFIFITLFNANAVVKVASVFSDNMVLQRDNKVPVWGTAAIDEKVTVIFGGQREKTTADEQGRWKVYLSPMKACAEGKELRISGSNSITFKNILVGDVWLMAGQSNMNKSVKTIGNINRELIEKAGNSLIRFLRVPNKIALEPQNSIDAKWEVSDTNSILSLTAIGAVFAQEVQPALNIPVGIISVNMGSTSVECWIPQEILEKDPFLASYRYWKDAIENWDSGGYERFL